jgi:tetratricopeptide (TPR) repeat protein
MTHQNYVKSPSSQMIVIQRHGLWDTTEDYDKAIGLNPSYALAYSNRGFTYCCLKQYERAIEDCNKAIELDPNLAGAYTNRGNAYED